MLDFLFVVKMLVATIVIVFLLQIKLDGSTVEDRAMFAIRESPVATWVQDVGTGGWQVFKKGLTRAMDSVKRLIRSSDSPGQRQEMFSLKRSEAFVKEQAAKLEEKARQAEAEAETEIETQAVE